MSQLNKFAAGIKNRHDLRKTIGASRRNAEPWVIESVRALERLIQIHRLALICSSSISLVATVKSVTKTLQVYGRVLNDTVKEKHYVRQQSSSQGDGD